jgi:hypothetical protein
MNKWATEKDLSTETTEKTFYRVAHKKLTAEFCKPNNSLIERAWVENMLGISLEMRNEIIKLVNHYSFKIKFRIYGLSVLP